MNSYKGYYNLHKKDDSLCNLKMSDVEEEDILEFITRLSVSKLKDGRQTGGSRKFVLVISIIGQATSGQYLHTLTATDVVSGWIKLYSPSI